MGMKLAVILGVMAGAFLLEAVLPLVRMVLRKRREAREAAIGTQLPSANANLAKTDVATTLPSVATPQSVFANVDAGDDGQGTSDEAQRLWEEARAMPHNFIPDDEMDRDYLAKVYDAAKLGHLEAMVKLGDYAYRHGAVVEAFYWTFLAEMKGAEGLDDALCEMRTQWLAEGCPEEYENTYVEFTEEQGVFARAVLRLQCDVDPQYACARLEELAECGVEEAQLFLARR